MIYLFNKHDKDLKIEHCPSIQGMPTSFEFNSQKFWNSFQKFSQIGEH